MAIRLLPNGTVEFDTVDELKTFQNKRHARRGTELKGHSADELNAELRKAGLAPEDLGSGDPEQDALDAAVVLISHGVPLCSGSGNYPKIRAAVGAIFGVRSHLALLNAVADNKKCFKKSSNHQGARLLLTPTGRKRLTSLKRSKASKKAVKLAETRIG